MNLNIYIAAVPNPTMFFRRIMTTHPLYLDVLPIYYHRVLSVLSYTADLLCLSNLHVLFNQGTVYFDVLFLFLLTGITMRYLGRKLYLLADGLLCLFYWGVVYFDVLFLFLLTGLTRRYLGRESCLLVDGLLCQR